MNKHARGRIAPCRVMLALVLVAVVLGAMPAFAAQRVALVIGNATYQSAPLANSVNDASDVANRLRGLGFSVIAGNNLDRDGMVRKVQEFRAALKPGGVGLFFYSGHGVEVGGLNYLLPVNNSGIRTVEDVEIYGLEAQRLVRQMEASGTQLNVVILDACRDNPLPARVRSAGKGLGRMDAQQGTLIAYATREGNTAADGSGRNSPYTRALLRWLGEPGLEVAQMFNRVGLEVSQATSGVQVPWVSSSPVPSVMLAGIGAPTTPAPAPFDPRQAELAFWNSTVQAGTLGAYRAYKQRYPTGDYTALSDIQIEKLSAQPMKPPTPAPAAQPEPVSTTDLDANGFIDRGNGVLIDTLTGLEWTQQDSGSDFDWDSAKRYCAGLRIGGSGWRLPSIDELAAIFSRPGGAATDSLASIYTRPGGATTKCGDGTCYVSRAFRLSQGLFWSNDLNGSSRTKFFSFSASVWGPGSAPNSSVLMSLCVRQGP